jgi:hypothetical protein
MKTLISLSPTKAVYEFSHNGNKRIVSYENTEDGIVDFERISSEEYAKWISWIFVEPAIVEPAPTPEPTPAPTPEPAPEPAPEPTPEPTPEPEEEEGEPNKPETPEETE